MLENFRSQKIIWDRANKTIFEKIEANSGDSNGRKLVVQVINQGVTENLLGTSLLLGWKYRNSAKGLDAFDVVDASKGIFEIYYTTEMLSNIGNIGASLILTDSTSRIESSTFTISVTPSTVDDESVESQNSFTALTEALVKVNEWDGRIDAVEQDYANRAEVLEETYAPRLTEVAEQLEQKATKGEIELSDINKNRTQFDGTWFSDSFLEDLANGEINTTILETGSVKEQHMASKAIQSEHTSFLSDENLFSGVYEQFSISGNSIGGGLYRSNVEGRMAIVKIEPNKTYRIVKSPSDKFRLALNKTYPKADMYVDNYIKDETTTTPEDQYSYEITTGRLDNYLCVYVSYFGEEPNLLIQNTEKTILKKEVMSPNIVLGKNLSRGKYLNATIAKNTAGAYGIVEKTGTDFNGWLEITKVKPNSEYVVSKTTSNRFRIGVTTEYPQPNAYNIRLAFEDDSSNQAKITTLENENYLVSYVSNDSPPPIFLQIEEGVEQTEWETNGYKLEPMAKPYIHTNVDKTINGITDIMQFGAIGNGIADDSDAILQALEYGKGGIVVIPKGVFKVLRTIWIPENTTLVSSGGKIILGDNFNLDRIPWRDSIYARPIMANVPNNNNVVVKGLKIEGNKKELLTGDRLLGLAFADTENSKAINTQADWVNILEDLITREMGYNIATTRAKNIVLEHCRANNSGYEPFGIFDKSRDITVLGGHSGSGWRTSFQIHRDCKDIKVSGLTINQNHPVAHSAFTMHGMEGETIDNVQIDNMTLKSITDDTTVARGGIQSVEGFEYNVSITNSKIHSNNEAIYAGPSNTPEAYRPVEGWKVLGNDIKGKKGINAQMNNSIVKDNTIDSTEKAVRVNGDRNIVKDNLLKTNKEVDLVGINYVEQDNF